MTVNSQSKIEHRESPGGCPPIGQTERIYLESVRQWVMEAGSWCNYETTVEDTDRGCALRFTFEPASVWASLGPVTIEYFPEEVADLTLGQMMERLRRDVEGKLRDMQRPQPPLGRKRVDHGK